MNGELPDMGSHPNHVLRKTFDSLKSEVFEGLIHDVVEKMELNSDEKLEAEKNASDDQKEQLEGTRKQRNLVLC